MGFRRCVGTFVLLAAVVAPYPAAAIASEECVSYSATAPGAGTKTDTKCPVTNPSSFTMRTVVGDCEGVPVAGVKECVVVTFYSPL